MKLGNFVGVSNNVKTALKVSAIVFSLAYFLFHAISGENGLIAYVKTKRLVEEKGLRLEQIMKDLEALKRNVGLLSDKTLDKDLLEERCRLILNYSAKNDSIIRTKTLLGD